MSNILDASKNTLGKLLASENIRIEHQKVAGPSFDVKDRVLILPVWKDLDADLYDLMIGHEVGHALYTPSEGWMNEVKEMGTQFKQFLNIVEDVRIENKMKRKYPGLRKPMYNGYTQLVERKFFGVTVEEMKYLPFADRVNVHFKLGARADISFTDEEQHLVDRIEVCETWDEVLLLAKELHSMANDEKSDMEELFEDLMDALNNDNLNETSDESSGDGMTQEELDQKVSELSEKLREQGKDIMADALEKASAQTKERLSNWLKDFSVNSITEKAFEENQETLIDPKALPASYINFPMVDVSKWVIPHHITHKNMSFNDFLEQKRNVVYQEFMAVNKRYVNYMVKEFELRRNAKQFAKAKVSKTGKLDIDKVWRYRLSEDLFLQSTVVPNGKNHGMLMMIDLSSSMSDNIRGTIEQLITLVLFCRKVNIPYEVYGFLDNPSFTQEFTEAKIPTNNEQRNVLKDRTLFIDRETFRLKQLLTDTMKLNEFNTAIQNLLLFAEASSSSRRFGYSGYLTDMSMQLCSTPLNESIIVLTAIAEQFKTRTKVEILNTIILTDGDASYSVDDFYDGGHVKQFNTYNNRVILKYGQHEEQVARHSVRATESFIKMYKKITNSRVFGIYLMDGAYKSTILRKSSMSKNFSHELHEKQYTEQFVKNRVFAMKNVGYDVYYMLPGTELEIAEVNMDTVIKTHDKNGLLRAFKKMQNSKMNSRVFLNQFIVQIS